MRALVLVADRQLTVTDIAPPPPGAGELQIRVGAVALNPIDVWGYRGMAFARRKPAAGMKPVIDTEVPLDDVAAALTRTVSRQVFGKIVVQF
jgi:NADPH:quinone reductase-like Zn-dependent oxidoreductase